MISATRSFFTERLPAFLARSEPVPVEGVFVFDVRGDGGDRWTIDLRNVPPHCRSGAAPQPDCTIIIENEDLSAVLRLENDIEELFYRQQVQVIGDLEKAAGLLQLFAGVLASAVPNDLATLLAPRSVEEFLANDWPSRHVVVPPDEERAGALRSIAPLRDVAALLAHWRGTVRVFPPGEPDRLSPHVTTEAAAQLYDRGFTLVFDSVDRQVPALHAWLERIQVELSLPPNVWGRCMVYASAPGGGFNAHFDENANFAIQLLGAKAWRIAPNPDVVEPTAGHRMGGRPQPEVLAEARGPLPERMPDDAFTVTLKPGGLLFLPRGYWHQTTVLEESLSLNFTFDQPCWADILTSAIRARLIRHAEFRALATGVGSSDPSRASVAGARAATLLQDLAVELGRIDAKALLEEVRPRAGGVELLDLKRDWVSALSHLGRPEEGKTRAPAPAGETSVGMLLYERLLVGFENPGGVDGECQFELDGPGGEAFSLLVSSSGLKYRGGRAEHPAAQVRMSTAVAREIALGDNIGFHDQDNFEHIDADGDMALLGMLAQMTKLPNRDAGARFAVAEERAATLPRMAEPERIKRPSARQVSEAIEASVPLLVEGGLEGWDEAFGWTFESLRRQFGHLRLKSTIGIGTLAEFLDELGRTTGEHVPYTLGSIMPDELVRFFPPPYFEPASFGSAQLWMGSAPGRISTLLHRDSAEAFLGQVIGRKQFKLYSPDQTPYMYVFKSYNRDQPCWVNPWEPDFERFPLFKRAHVTEFTLSPGELLIIPRGWYHTVLALDTTLSVGFHREPVTDFGKIVGRDAAQ